MFHNQENIEQQWWAWQGCKEKATGVHLQFVKNHCDKPKGYLDDGWNQNRTFCFKLEALCLEERKHCIPA